MPMTSGVGAGPGSGGAAPLVLRSVSAVWIPVVSWTALGLGAADIVVRGTPGERLAFLPWLAVIAYGLWLVLWAPRLVVGSDDVVVHELLRTYVLPYDAITDIRRGGLLRIDYTDARGRTRTLRPWNGPGIGRRPTVTGRPADHPADQLVARWQAGGGSGRTVATAWRWRQLVVLAALVVAAVAVTSVGQSYVY